MHVHDDSWTRRWWPLSHPETCKFRKNLKLLFLIQELARIAFMLPYIIFVLLSALVIESV
jgi:hypothetical protein